MPAVGARPLAPRPVAVSVALAYPNTAMARDLRANACRVADTKSRPVARPPNSTLRGLVARPDMLLLGAPTSCLTPCPRAVRLRTEKCPAPAQLPAPARPDRPPMQFSPLRPAELVASLSEADTEAKDRRPFRPELSAIVRLLVPARLDAPSVRPRERPRRANAPQNEADAPTSVPPTLRRHATRRPASMALTAPA